jgi:serine/threonine protein phosphatase PrpC
MMLMSAAPQIQSGIETATGTVDHVAMPPASPRVKIECGALTHQGKVRTNNEDHFLVARLAKSMQICQTSLKNNGETRFSDEDGYLMVVADGMGGAAGGERASAMAVESVETFALNTLKWFLHFGKADESQLVAELRKGLELADQAVVDEAESNARFYGMGTTLTMTYSMGPDLYIVHAGDSRAYLYRKGNLEQITSDHTLVQLLISGGVLTPEDARTHARRNVVTNVIGGPSAGVHAEIHKVRLEHGDVLLLCSDGLTEPVEDRLIATTLAEMTDPVAAANRLIALALENGGPDNVTAIVARYSIEEPKTSNSSTSSFF